MRRPSGDNNNLKGETMFLKCMLATVALTFTSAAFADLTPWEDYETSDAVWSVTTIKVDPNMGDAYLEGLAKTWVASNKIAKIAKIPQR